MSFEQRVRETLKDAGSRIDVSAGPTEERLTAASRGRRRRSRPMLAFAAGFAAVLLFGVVAVLVSGDREAPTGDPEPGFTGVLGSVIGLLPDGFDPELAVPLLTFEGNSEQVAGEYLESRIGTVGAEVSQVEEHDGYTLVRWAWGHLLNPDDSQSERGEAGWLLLRPMLGGYGVLAATTDGVDLSRLALSAGAVTGVVLSDTDELIGADVLDPDGLPVDGSPYPEGFSPDADFVWGTAGVDTPPLTIDVPATGQVTIRVNRVGGTLLSISEVALGVDLTETPPPPDEPPEQGLDLSESMWVTHGPDGVRLDDGTLLWETEPFPAGIARDRQGGLVFADSTGVWWFQNGAVEPELVVDDPDLHALVAVATSPTGPVAVFMSDAAPRFYGLTDSSPDAPLDAPVDISPEPPWFTWTAANGLSAWVTEPEVELDAEGQPSQALEPAHLVIADGDTVLMDTRIGDFDQVWARIHDFDGQRLVVSRGPYEPAMPEETFLLVDLATGEVAELFAAGGTTATFTGADTDWNGPVLAPDLVAPPGGAEEPTEEHPPEPTQPAAVDAEGLYVITDFIEAWKAGDAAGMRHLSADDFPESQIQWLVDLGTPAGEPYECRQWEDDQGPVAQCYVEVPDHGQYEQETHFVLAGLNADGTWEVTWASVLTD